MIVYGKRDILIDPRAGLLALRDMRDHWSVFLTFCQIAQALIDHETGEGPDLRTPLRGVLHETARECAHLVAHGRPEDLASFTRDALDRLAAFPLPSHVRAREPEGFSFYDLHPEAWVMAGRRLASEGGEAVVIGLRSIGLALGACVAAGCGASAFETLRPRGHPFARRIEAGRDISGLTHRSPGTRFIIVDEGPGLSGSSVASCIDWLCAHGVQPARIVVLASHDGAPGGAGGGKVQASWRSVRRSAAPPSGCALHGGPARWFAHVTGECAQTDISAGRWRAHQPCFADAPVDGARERRKFLLLGDHGRIWLARFVGLGSAGEATLWRAKRLADRGLIPPVVAQARGYALTVWHQDAQKPEVTTSFACKAGLYLGRRAALLGGAEAGASLVELADMALANLSEVRGLNLAGSLAPLRAMADALQGECRPTQQDGRVQHWEWLETLQGLIKVDAIDHCASHDLIGAQDVAWDLAGFAVEFGPVAAGYAQLATERELGRKIHPGLFDFMKICWIGFETGLALLALKRVPDEDQIAHRKRLAFLGNRLDQSGSMIMRNESGERGTYREA